MIPDRHLREDAEGPEAKRIENYADRLANMEIEKFMASVVRIHGNPADAVASLYCFLRQLGARGLIDAKSMMMIDLENDE